MFLLYFDFWKTYTKGQLLSPLWRKQTQTVDPPTACILLKTNGFFLKTCNKILVNCFDLALRLERSTCVFFWFGFVSSVTQWTQLCKYTISRQVHKRTLLVSQSVCRSVVSDSLWPHGLQPTRLLCPWNSPGKNAGVGCHFFLQGIFPSQGSNPGLLHCRQTLYPLSHRGSRTWEATNHSITSSLTSQLACAT